MIFQEIELAMLFWVWFGLVNRIGIHQIHLDTGQYCKKHQIFQHWYSISEDFGLFKGFSDL